jgi:hypothetical protein
MPLVEKMKIDCSHREDKLRGQKRKREILAKRIKRVLKKKKNLFVSVIIEE